MADIGTIGENAISTWCAELDGVTANGSRIDDKGWDFIVELPTPLDVSTFGLSTAPIECKIQVKTGKDKTNSTPVKLSNLLRMATSPLPNFFAFIQVNEKNKIENAYLVHVDFELITKILKEIHKRNQGSKKFELHKSKMRVGFKHQDKLESLDGLTLEKHLKHHIGTDINKYIELKTAHIKSTGFENGFATIKFKTTKKNTINDLINASIGMHNQLEISDFSGFNTRFGINEKNPFLTFSSGTLVIGDIEPSLTGTLTFKEDKISKGITFNVELIPSIFNESLPDEMKVIRFKCEHFDIEMRPLANKMEFKFNFTYETRIEISKLNDLLKLSTMLKSPPESTILQFTGDNGQTLKLSITDFTLKFNFENEIIILDKCIKIITELNYTKPIKITLNELRSNNGQIAGMYACLYSKVAAIGFKTELDIELKAEHEALYLYMTRANIGTHIIIAIVTFIGPIENNGMQLSIKPKICRTEKKYIFNEGEEIPVESIEQVFSEIVKGYEKNYDVFTPNRIE